MTDETVNPAPTIEVLPTGPEPLMVLRSTETNDDNCRQSALGAFHLASRLVRLTSAGIFVANVPEEDQVTNHSYLRLWSYLSHYAQEVCRNNLRLGSYGAHGFIRVEHKDQQVTARNEPILIMPLFVSSEAVHGICIDLRNPGAPRLDYANVPVDGNYHVTGIY